MSPPGWPCLARYTIPSARRLISRALARVVSASGWVTSVSRKLQLSSAEKERRCRLGTLMTIERPIEISRDGLFDDRRMMSAHHRDMMLEAIAGDEVH